MTLTEVLKAALLGLLEGATEFLPVSSTGHLLLLQRAFGLTAEGDKTFAVLIQFGAILALVGAYFGRLWAVARALPGSPDARRFVLGVLLAFLPAAVVGVLARDFIRGVLFDPYVVCAALVLGGIVLLRVDRADLAPEHDDAMGFSLRTCLGIGLFQCLAMVPGVSRSGATIVGAMLLGSTKRAAAEFSFFLAMPTMAGAFAYELLKSRHDLSFEQGGLIAVGFLASFLSGLLVVRALLAYVAAYGFALFAWWRIGLGSLGLALLLAGR